MAAIILLYITPYILNIIIFYILYIILLHIIYYIYYLKKKPQMQCVTCGVSLILNSNSTSNRLISQYTKVFKES